MENEQTQVQETEIVETVDTQQEETKVQEVKTFTQEELDAIVKSNVARAIAKVKREEEQRINEAEKVKKMNAEQKLQYELEKREQRIAELEAQQNRSNMEREATVLLQKRGLSVNNEVLDYVVKGTAEDTLVAIDTFERVVNALAESKVQTMLKGKTPTSTKVATSGVTKAEFENMTYTQKTELFMNNPEAYHKLNNA